MAEIKRVEPLSLGKLQGIAGAVIGVLVGIAYAVFAGVSAAGFGLGGPETGAIIVVALIGAPVFYAVFGFLGGLIAGWLYNLAAGAVGGVEVVLAGTAVPGQHADLDATDP